MPNVAPKAQSVPTIKDVKEASEVISALKCVYLDTDTTCAISDPTDEDKSVTFGVAINSGIIGDPIDIVNYGQIDDAFFTFTGVQLLYLGPLGTITNIAPSSGFRTVIGKSLGIGSIFVNIEEPIEL